MKRILSFLPYCYSLPFAWLDCQFHILGGHERSYSTNGAGWYGILVCRNSPGLDLFSNSIGDY